MLKQISQRDVNVYELWSTAGIVFLFIIYVFALVFILRITQIYGPRTLKKWTLHYKDPFNSEMQQMERKM